MTPTSTFTGKTILITGGTTGIGAAIADGFNSRGAQVIVTGKDDADVQQWHQNQTRSGQIRAISLDVGDGDAVNAFVQSLNHLDYLINCAGMLIRQGGEFELANFERVVDVNLTGMMRTNVACKPLLKQSQGAIVNIASMFSFFGAGHAPAYSASKGAVVQLTRSLAVAWATDGIRVNAVAPGWITTPLTQPLRDDPAREKVVLDRTPMKRWGLPEEVAGPVMFLCSQEASFITGAVLPVDGGYLVM